MSESNLKNTEKLSEDLSQNLGKKTESQVKHLPSWRLLLPLLFQLVIIASVPAQAVYTYVTGKTVVLQTAPVDPYDFLRGYYQVLSYDISTSETLKTLPGWEKLAEDQNYLPSETQIYVVLEKPTQEEQQTSPPQAWKPVRVSSTLPKDLSENQIALQGESNGWRIEYGLETYYMPENLRRQVNASITEAQRDNPESFVVEIKVDSQGKAIPMSLWVRNQNYKF
ncbi:MAG: GDYXXLXY domain-containing protein [Cyanobacteriota bacterium]|nr:GDYXXLXY domain-containing protein [Cyanobacteriota bacterium]